MTKVTVTIEINYEGNGRIPQQQLEADVANEMRSIAQNWPVDGFPESVNISAQKMRKKPATPELDELNDLLFG